MSRSMSECINRLVVFQCQDLARQLADVFPQDIKRGHIFENIKVGLMISIYICFGCLIDTIYLLAYAI